MIGAFLAELHRGVLDKRHGLERPETVIGRDLDAHIRIDDKSVSRHHAAILRRGERYVIRDLGSRNGISVNEQSVSSKGERELRANDCIFLGKAVLCFLIAEDKVSVPTENHIDPVTGIPNRRWLLDQLAASMSSARADHRPLGLSLVGIDDLAGLNQQLGQVAGDSVLRHVAGVINAALEPGETMARYRGGVFAVISPDLLDGLMLDRAQRLRARVEDQPASHKNELIMTTVSVGVTPMMALDQDKILSAADAALSRAKQRGNCVERASREPDAQTERYQRRLVSETLFEQWLKPPVTAFVVRWLGAGRAPTRQTPIDFELQSAIQQNLSGDELAAYPDNGGWVVVTVPRADAERVPRLCDAIRASFDQSLAARGSSPVGLSFGPATSIDKTRQALALAK